MRRAVAVVVLLVLAGALVVVPGPARAATVTLSSGMSARYWLSYREFATQEVNLGNTIYGGTWEGTVNVDQNLMGRACHASARIYGEVWVARVAGTRAEANYYAKFPNKYYLDCLADYHASWHKPRWDEDEGDWDCGNDYDAWSTSVDVTGAEYLKVSLYTSGSWDDMGPIYGGARAKGYIDEIVYYEPVGETAQASPISVYDEDTWALYYFSPGLSGDKRIVRATLQLNVTDLSEDSDGDYRYVTLVARRATGSWGASGYCDVLQFSGWCTGGIGYPGTLSIDVTSLVSNSSFTVAVSTTSQYGAYLSRYALLELVVDEAPPTVSVSPEGYLGTQGAVVTVSASDDVGVASTEYAWALEGSQPQSWTSLSGSVATPDAEGRWYLWVRVRDVAARTTVSSFGPYIVDRTPPSVSVSLADRAWSPDPIRVVPSVSDPVSGVASREYAWSQAREGSVSWQPVSGGELVQSAEGVWYLHLRAVDRAGNASVKVFGPYRLDRTPPSISAEPPALSSGVRVAVVVVGVQDGLSGVSVQRYGWGADPSGPQVWAALGEEPPVQSVPGVWYLHLRAVDVAGNEASLVAGPYRVVAAGSETPQPVLPPTDEPDWWTPPWYPDWYGTP